MICVLLLVGTWRSHRLVFPASTSSLRMYFPSGEMAASRDLPLSVICEMVIILEGNCGFAAAEHGIDAVACRGQHDQRD